MIIHIISCMSLLASIDDNSHIYMGVLVANKRFFGARQMQHCKSRNQFELKNEPLQKKSLHMHVDIFKRLYVAAGMATRKSKEKSKGRNNMRSTAKLIGMDLSSIRTLLCFISSCLKGRVVSQLLWSVSQAALPAVWKEVSRKQKRSCVHAITLHTCHLKRSTY